MPNHHTPAAAAAKKTAAPKATKPKKGGNLTKDLAALSVPFGIVLAQKGLRQYLDSQQTTALQVTKKKPPVPKKASSKKTASK